MKTVFLFLVICLFCAGRRDRFYDVRVSHPAKPLTDGNINLLANQGDMQDFDRILTEILIPRVPGSPGHEKVKQFIVSELATLGWDVELDSFKAKTPLFGELPFSNIIGKLNPKADRFLVLSCHYDSKYFREAVFVGAIDSAVPCAMILNLIRIMKPYLDQIQSKTDLSLAVVFFDGEEAFRTWSQSDSLYGSKHLANKWAKEAYPLGSNDGTNNLHRIDLLVLLDLIGTPDPIYYNYNTATERWYLRMVDIEERLIEGRLLRQYSYGYPEQRYFQSRSVRVYIDDDHTPFLNRNVPVLHIIPKDFPSVWHQPTDNRAALDFETIENQNKICRAFVAEYLHLDIY